MPARSENSACALEDVLLTRAVNAGANAERPTDPRISVVIPALNEAENLPHVLPLLPAKLHEVVLVDGNSRDNTVAIARQLLPEIRIVTQDRPGKGAALCAGFAACTGDIVVMLDADGSTDPAEVPLFVDALRAGADFVKGSRFLPGGGTADMPLHRQLGNLSFVFLTRILFGTRFSDLCYGYNAFWLEVVDRLELDATGFEIETMMNIRAHCAGLKIAEVPSFEHKRRYGDAQLRTFADGWRVLKTILAERRLRRRRRNDARTPRAAEAHTRAESPRELDPQLRSGG